jgi:phage terminase large subunit
MTTAKIELPPKLIPIFSGQADVRGAKGGRGSGKTRSFAKMTAVRGYMWSKAGREGIILCGRQFMNSLDDSSLEEIKAAIRSEPWLEAHYEIGEKYVRTKDGRISYKFTGLDRNVDSVKSKSRILLCWVDEAEPVTEDAWMKLIPTLREEDSELWLTWNPERKKSATNLRFGNPTDPRTKITEINWRDNPWFPKILDRVRLRDFTDRPDQYGHVWEGEFRTVVEGAYYAQAITVARTENRITRLAADPLMTIRLICDIGGTGKKSDAFAIWAAQFVGREIRWLDYYEAVGQPIGHHLHWMRENKYTPGNSRIILPHDGDNNDRVYDVSYRSAFEEAGYDVDVIPNQGTGAAKLRIEAARRLFPRMWFDQEKCTAGIEAIGWYHEKRDEERGVGLGPEHDWSSHGADAFGLGAIAYEEPRVRPQESRYSSRSRSSTSWMAG